MAIHAIHDDGALHWRCHHKKCKPLQAHVSHEDIKFVNHDLVALPRCACGSQTFVKVKFSDEELAADNMTQYGMVPTPMTLPHAVTGEPMEVLIPALMPIGRNPFVDRHLKFGELLEQHGKRYEPAQSQADTESEAGNESSATTN